MGFTEPKNRQPMPTWILFWSPEGREIARVTAPTARDAVKRAPKPYSKYKGEIYAEHLDAFEARQEAYRQDALESSPATLYSMSKRALYG